MNNSHICKIGFDAKVRVDKYICDDLNICSRSKVKREIFLLTINGKPAKFSDSVKDGDLVEFDFIDEKKNPTEIVSQKMDLNIIFEDKNTIVLNKPQGVVVHPACGNYTDTLVNGLLNYIETEDFDDETRPGIVHRLDKDTSGVLLVAKNQEALEYYSKEFHDRNVTKEYRAILKGRIVTGKINIDKNIIRSPHDRKKFETTDSTIKGRTALTELKVIETFSNYTYVALFPKTGRTHQLRVHTKFLGFPILGDPIYSRKDGLFADTPLMLHAHKLTIKLFGSDDFKTFTAPLTDTFLAALDKAKNIK